MTQVAVLGIGRMGGAMARMLAQAGHSVELWNRSPDVAQTLAADIGATAHSRAADAVSGADLVLSVLASGPVTQEVLGALNVGGALGERTIVCDMGTSGVATADYLSELLGDRFVDSPVSGSVPAVLGSTLLVMASGSQASVDLARPTLVAFAKEVIYLGGAGSGQTMKLALNLIVHTLNSAIAEGIGLAAEAGIDPAVAYNVLRNSSVSSPYAAYKEAAFLTSDVPVAMSLDLVAKDLTLIADLARAQGLALVTLDGVRREVDAARESGFGPSDMADLLAFVRGREAPTRPK